MVLMLFVSGFLVCLVWGCAIFISGCLLIESEFHGNKPLFAFILAVALVPRKEMAQAKLSITFCSNELQHSARLASKPHFTWFS